MVKKALNNKIRSIRKPAFFRRLYVQLTLLGAITLSLSIFLFAWKIVNEQSDFALDSIKSQAVTLATNIATASGSYIVSEDFGALEELLIQSAAYREVLAIRVSDKNGVVFGNVKRDKNGIPQAVYEQVMFHHPETVKTHIKVHDNVLVLWVPIEKASLGWMQLDYSLATIEIVQKNIWQNGVSAALISIVLSISILILLLNRPMRSISNATLFARDLYKNTGQIMTVEKSTYEVEQLEHSLNFAARRNFDTNKDLNDFKFALDAHAIVGISDTEGVLSYVNDKFCEISGYTRDELIGNGYQMLSSGKQSKMFYKDLWETIKSGQVWNGEIEDKNKKGELYWVDTTIVPLSDEQGVPYQYTSIQTDITERKSAEEVNERLGRILDESLNEIYMFSSVDFLFLRVNRGAEENLGYRRDELNTKTAYDIKPEFEKDSFAKYIEPLVSGEAEELNFETFHQRKDGSTYPVSVHLQISRAETPPIFVAVVLDITERKNAERKLQEYSEHLEDMVEERTDNLKAANKELESFCYSVSHDLRAPLRSIDGFSLALLEDYSGVMDEAGQNYLNRVRSSTQRMGQLIDDLLKLSHVIRSEMKRKKVNMTDLAKTVEIQLREREPERNVDFILSQELLAEGDENLLLAMFENLLGNAWKFTSNKTSAKIELGELMQGGRRVYYVKDNGAGFNEAYVHKMFEPFQRLHTVQEYEGTGVGLATVQRIINRHGGEVWAEGAIDQGATVYFTLGDG